MKINKLEILSLISTVLSLLIQFFQKKEEKKD